MKKKVSIKDIAEQSGVSVATVSRVLNDNGRFSKETKKRVLEVIERNNYEVNTIAKSLRSKKSETIGILIPDISNSFFAKIVEEIERIMFERGYATIICNTARNKEKELAYIKMLQSKMVDGLIVISGFNEFDAALTNNQFPIICIDRKPSQKSNTVLIESDHYNGGRLATQTLIDNGCKEIAIVMHRTFLSSSVERFEGYKQALKDNNLPFRNRHVIHIDDTKQALSRTEKACVASKIALQESPQIDGVFAINDRLAIGTIHAAHALELVVGKDIKIIGFDNDSISKYCFPRLSTISQNTLEIAEKGCDSLLQLIENRQAKVAKHQVIPVEVVKRETT